MEQILNYSPVFPYIFLLVGFVFLIKGADFFVDGCSSVARRFHIPTVIIGLTIVALGTSAPEAAVSITSSLKHANALAVSNVIGSNLFNLLMVVGVCAVILPIHVSKDIIKRDYPLCIIVTALMLLFSVNFFVNGFEAGKLSRIYGIILLVIFVSYLLFLIKATLKDKKAGNNEDESDSKPMSGLKSAIYIILGAAGIAFGGDFVVDCASSIALTWGLSETLVGLTIVALGTSLPELVTSIVAARKGENDLAMGNVVGSNLFNILFVLGMAATVCPIDLSQISNPMFTIIDMIILLAITVIVYIFVKNKDDVDRKEGAVMVGIYVIYMVYIIMR